MREMNLLVSTWQQHPGAAGLLSLERIPLKDTYKTGIVTLEGEQVRGIIEKPLPTEAPTDIASTPLYVFSARILTYLSQVPISTRGEYEIQDAIQLMIDEGLTVNGTFLDNRLTLTTADDLLSINLEYLYAKQHFSQIETDLIGSNTRLIEPVFIEAGVEIGSNCQIGPGVLIEKNVQIGDNVYLKNTVVLRDTTIEKSTAWVNRVIY